MNLISNDTRSCLKCGYETFDALAKCPQGGRRMQTGRRVRTLGWVLVVTGAFLVVFMGAITYMLAGIVYHSAEPDAHARFTGSPQMATFIFGLFGLIILIGFASLVSGIWQVRYGRPNRKLMIISPGLGLLLFIIAKVFLAFH